MLGMALAVVERAGDEGHVAIRFEPDAAQLLADDACRFEKAANSEPTQETFALRLDSALAEAGDVRRFHRLVHQSGEIAAVVGQARERLVGQLVRADLIAAPQFDPVDPRNARHLVDDPLHHVVRSLAPGAAIGAHERRIRQRALHLDRQARKPIHAVEVGKDSPGRRAETVGIQIAAKIAEPADANSLKQPLFVGREFDRIAVGAAVIIRQETRRAIFRPFHWTAETFAACNAQICSGNETIRMPNDPPTLPVLTVT